jgi:hypothetical protein
MRAKNVWIRLWFMLHSAFFDCKKYIEKFKTKEQFNIWMRIRILNMDTGSSKSNEHGIHPPALHPVHIPWMKHRFVIFRRREIIKVKGQFYVLRLPKYWPPTPSRPGECAFVAGGGHTRRMERGGGGVSIFWKTQEDTALYSTYIESSLFLGFPASLACSLVLTLLIGGIQVLIKLVC